MKFDLVATCLFGLEHLLGEEIEALGYERVMTMDGRVVFRGDEEAVALAKANPKIAPWIEGKAIKKIIFVPGRILNIVAL